ncbi:MAG: hypothetical protein JW829_18450 [Pirellulales bacterium]|nr:hypothetical protein [Pirellulales bacterium]
MHDWPWRMVPLILCILLGNATFAVVPPADAEQGNLPCVATFRCDITPPLGEPMISCDKLSVVEQPLLAKGVVLDAGGKRYVICALDWCELCNGSHAAYCQIIATAADTIPSRVAIQCVHPHTAPVVDMDAQHLLTQAGYPDLHLKFQTWEDVGSRLAAAVKESLGKFEPFDRIGTGQAKVDRVAATRRPMDASGKIAVRFSTCADPRIRAYPDGKIDPYLKTITFSRGNQPLVRLHYYATHPQTRYGDGRASSDMVGDARETLERKEGVFQIYFTGCGGDITVGKYNDGSKEARSQLAGRLLAGMESAIAATQWAPVGPIVWRTYPLELPRRDDPGFGFSECQAQIKAEKTPPAQRMFAAVQVIFHQRSHLPIELNSLAIGHVSIVHLPGEPMIDFQLFAQQLKPDAFIAVAGYGDGGPGYICPEQAYREGGYEPTASHVQPVSEKFVKEAIAALLGTKE